MRRSLLRPAEVCGPHNIDLSPQPERSSLLSRAIAVIDVILGCLWAATATKTHQLSYIYVPAAACGPQKLRAAAGRINLGCFCPKSLQPTFRLRQ